MGLSKTEIFSTKQNELATLAKSLGHPARIAIIEYLLRQNACVCGDIVSELGLAQATVSQHLKELKNAGIITGDIEGTKVCYCINMAKWEQVRGIFGLFFDQKVDRNNCC